MSDFDDSPGRLRQVAVYTTGMLADQTPAVPVRYEELKRKASEALSEEAYAYVAGGAGSEAAVRGNDSAFDRWQVVPRTLRDVSERDLSVSVLDSDLPVPFLLAPIGALSIVHEDADLAVANACAALDVPMVCSTQSSEPLEDVADATGDAPAWFQLYWNSDRDVTESLLSRAEEAGYEAIVVTLDTPLLGWRERDVDLGYLPFLDGEGIANYLTDPAFRDRLDAPPEENPRLAAQEFVNVFGDPSLTWDDLSWLCRRTDLPVVVKGVLHPEDARLAVEHGADGVVVSNHGGRQVDRAIPALDALPDVIDAVGDGAAVLFDSGIRRGVDAIVAMALGADAVMLGRPFVYGLALEGEEGVEEVCKNVRADVDLTLGLLGRTSVEELDRSVLRRVE